MEKEEVENQVEQQVEGEKMSKAQIKKLAKQKEKDALKAQKQQQKQATEVTQEDVSVGKYGNYGVQGSYQKNENPLSKIENLNNEIQGQTVWIRGRVNNIRGKGNLMFIILRDNMYNVQCVASKSDKVSKQMLKFINTITRESIIDVQAVVTIPEQEIQSCTQKVELQIEQLFILSKADNNLPFSLDDASRKMDQSDFNDLGDDEQELQEEGKQVRVGMKTRLDNRVIDLRTPAKQAIFRLNSKICQLFREFLYKQDFTEIHTPKLLGGTSEGGSNVFRLDYFKTKGCLAQSPQLFKQMCVQGDFKRVFEVGPVFRAENSFTHRHMCEFTGLDLEMVIDHSYFELLNLISQMLCFIFNGIEERAKYELSIIKEQFPFEPFVVSDPVPFLTFKEGVALLKEHGIQQSDQEDLSTAIEKQLGDLVKQKYNTDFYILHRYPKAVRPFYTMLSPEDETETHSYDIFMRGEEITSGAQRIHDPIYLAQRAGECGIPPSTIQGYIDSFKFGAHPHGGCGIGLERVVMLYCNLRNIRNSSLFPRDPKRITP